MDTEKFKALLSDKEFVKKIVEMQTPEEVQVAFKEQGVEISIDEIGALGALINESLKKGNQPLTDQDLEGIAGGLVTEYELPKHDAYVLGAVVCGSALLGLGGVSLTLGTGVKWAIDKHRTNEKIRELKKKIAEQKNK